MLKFSKTNESDERLMGEGRGAPAPCAPPWIGHWCYSDPSSQSQYKPHQFYYNILYTEVYDGACFK